ncbi:hypothetical protein MMC07_007126 [Pseudocyphellaria aurata]|nr:hypothetical protein [Pseudocyphellaria aurata]
MSHSDKWRLLRKLLHQYFHEAKCEKEHVLLQNAEAVQMLNDFCVMPEQMMGHPKRFSNSIIMALAFGIRSSTPRTPHLVELYEIVKHWSALMEAGATPPVDIIPILKWVPERFFGNWITRSKNIRKAMDKLYGRTVSHVMQRRLKSGSRGSFLDGVLDQQEQLNLTRNQLNFLCGVLMEGGSDTSASIILAFIQAMIRFPHVQKKAQQEIDTIVGEDRSPLWSDHPNLPYVMMIIKETMRWRPVAPLAFPHALSTDDTIDGMKIPAGSIVIMNVWGLHHDPTRFSNPDVFDPECFTGRTLLAPKYAASADFENRDHYGYGAGRRICPGIHLGERNLFIAMAKLLWAFDFSAKSDAEGKAIPIDTDPETGYTNGFVRCPHPFAAEIKPRSEKRRETIMKEYESAKSDVFAKYEVA